MFPTILQLGPVVISTLGVLTAFGFFFGSFLIWRKGKVEHFEEVEIIDGVFLTALASLFFSRLGYVFFNLNNLKDFFYFTTKSGLSWHCGLIGAILVFWLYIRKKELPFFQLADIFVFGATVNLIFIKIGLFFSKFVLDKGLFPIWLVQALFLFAFFRLLFNFEKNYRTYEWYKDKRGDSKPGFLFFSFLIVVSCVNMITVFEKLDNPQFSKTLIVDFLIIAVASIWLFLRSGKGQEIIKIDQWMERRNKGLKKSRNNKRVKTGMEAKK